MPCSRPIRRAGFFGRSTAFGSQPSAVQFWTENYPRTIKDSVSLLSNGIQFVIPHRVLIVVFSLASIAPWISWGFGLRTLLIAMTLIAAALGPVMAFG